MPYNKESMNTDGYVRVLRTIERPRMDAACSLLMHEGIPYRLRETRELFAYLPHEDLQLYVPAAHAGEAAELMTLLDQPAFPADQPYRTPPGEEEDYAQEAAEEPALTLLERQERLRERTRSTLIFAAICLAALAAVTIGLSLTYRDWFGSPEPRLLPMSTRYGAFRAP